MSLYWRAHVWYWDIIGKYKSPKVPCSLLLILCFLLNNFRLVLVICTYILGTKMLLSDGLSQCDMKLWNYFICSRFRNKKAHVWEMLGNIEHKQKLLQSIERLQNISDGRIKRFFAVKIWCGATIYYSLGNNIAFAKY